MKNTGLERRINDGSDSLEFYFYRYFLWCLYNHCHLVQGRLDKGILYGQRKRFSPFANGMATAADWMSAATFISMAGGIAAAGYGASKFLMGWTGGFVLLTTLMVPYLRKFGKATIPDFIGDRYYSDTARLVAVICAIFICMTYIMGQMRGVGIVFSRLFDIEIWMGVIIGAGIVFFYAGLGGMKGITYTQVAQYCVMVFAYTIPVFFISPIITDKPSPNSDWLETMSRMGRKMRFR